MDGFLKTIRNAIFGNGQEEQTTPQNVEARSGQNVQFVEDIPSQNFTNAFNDIVNFYQKEFKVTPRVDISKGTYPLPPDVSGATQFPPDKTGQYNVQLRNLTEDDEAEELGTAQRSAQMHWHPTNSGDLGKTAVHELGHALVGTLFPTNTFEEDNKANETLVSDALKDIRTGDDYADAERGAISGYAVSGGAPETIAEALTDYYYNREGAQPLSRAIVNRLKTKGALYGMQQEGGVDTDPSADNFIKNLRRYSVIK